MKFRFLVFVAGIVGAMTVAHGEGVNKEIRFAPGASSAQIEQSVVRGDRDYYTLSARAGQQLTISISALENNAEFSIYKPGYKIKKLQDYDDIAGEMLYGNGPKDNGLSWQGKLPVSGKYLVVVGGTRGNATYKLKVSIK